MTKPDAREWMPGEITDAHVLRNEFTHETRFVNKDDYLELARELAEARDTNKRISEELSGLAQGEGYVRNSARELTEAREEIEMWKRELCDAVSNDIYQKAYDAIKAFRERK